jgi:hypothetical protein
MTLKIPESDLRLLYQSLLRNRQRRSETLERVRAAWVDVVAPAPLRSQPGVTRLEKTEDRPGTDDRPLSYPFTRGIRFTNDGVGYGELVWERRVQAREEFVSITSRRTRTGKVQLYFGDLKGPAPAAEEHAEPRRATRIPGRGT